MISTVELSDFLLLSHPEMPQVLKAKRQPKPLDPGPGAAQPISGEHSSSSGPSSLAAQPAPNPRKKATKPDRDARVSKARVSKARSNLKEKGKKKQTSDPPPTAATGPRASAPGHTSSGPSSMQPPKDKGKQKETPKPPPQGHKG
jgi:hypothetical protein